VRRVSKKDSIEAWLSEFKSKATRKAYRSALRKYQRHVGINLNDYIKSNRDFLADFKSFVASLENPPKTVELYAIVAKEFLKEQRVLKLTDDEWKRIRSRQQIVRVALTQDKAPTKAELRTILNYLDVKGRALVLFLASSGARIGETTQIKTEDLDLNSDPPKATIHSATTKGVKGGRTVRMSYEARDAIKDWLKVKGSLKKKNGKKFDSERVFPFVTQSVRDIWNRAVDKAGLGKRDENTNRRILHIHSLRKFFRSNIGLDFDLTNALMGHYAYLDKSYRRLKEEDIDRAYLAAMKNVSIYTATTSRKEEVRRALAMQGLTLQDVMDAFRKEMLATGEGTGGGVNRKLPIDENYIASLEDEEIGRYAFKALRRKLLGETKANGGRPAQKVIKEDELEAYLAKGWVYINSLNNGSGKCIVAKP
jgi:integrase